MLDRSMVFTEVIENVPHSDGTINAVVRVRAISKFGAKHRAVNRAFLHNGYSTAILNSPGVGFEVDSIESEIGPFWRVELRLKGLGD